MPTQALIRDLARSAIERAWERAMAAGTLPALPDDAPPPAVEVERPAGLLRIFVVGQYSHLVKAGGEQRVDGFGAAGQGDVALPVLNGPHCRQDFD